MFALFNGEVVPYDDAKIHFLTSGFKYGAAVFEGIRGYRQSSEGVSFFRLQDHLKRLRTSAMLMRMGFAVSDQEVIDGLRVLIRRNQLDHDIYIRILVWVGSDDGTMLDLDPIHWGAAARAAAKSTRTLDGIHLGVTSWRRLNSDASPVRIKATANYLNGRLAGLEGAMNGYDDVAFLDRNGYITEGPATNIFAVLKGKLVTPPITSDILHGITRDTVLTLSREMAIETSERRLSRSDLYAADEVFVCGTWHEITPVLRVDHYTVADGVPGTVTRDLQQRFENMVRGNAGRPEWLTSALASSTQAIEVVR